MTVGVTTRFARTMAATQSKARMVVLALVAAGSLAACEPRVSNHGYVPDPGALSRIEPGVHTQLEVAQFLGTPSTAALFGEETWLYITERREEFAFFRPEIVAQEIVAIAFDNRGVVKEIAGFTLADGIVIDPVSRTTPTYGKQLSLLEQMFGNIGRFNTEGQSGVSLPGQ
ncbi:MAG: outer membrane protein assembly factor BamE [Rhodospirillaceae bacterium]|jgi:outer membrane protein assembly factor BamE (lipoprotein component of BamABCDE complex)|nr:outer membrane protein assembly factor BamE [Rhodospirillaceae bacterium]MBT7645657.1 outer membrane protein assembly factor BamE [Rhodospirillaceae bacterium]